MVGSTECKIISIERGAHYRGTTYDQNVELELETGVKLSAFDMDMELRDNSKGDSVTLLLSGFITQPIHPSNKNAGVKLPQDKDPQFYLVGELEEISGKYCTISSPELNLKIPKVEVDKIEEEISKGDKLEVPVDRLDIKDKIS